MISVMHAPRPDPLLGFYGPGSMMWRINREAVLLGAGPAALLLQVAHPSVARGVAEHSTFEEDPFARLSGHDPDDDGSRLRRRPAGRGAPSRLNHVHAGVRGEGIPGARSGAPAVGPGDADRDERSRLLALGSRRSTTRTASNSGKRRERSAFGLAFRSAEPGRLARADRLLDIMLAPTGPIHATPTARRLAPLIVRPPLPVVPRKVGLISWRCPAWHSCRRASETSSASAWSAAQSRSASVIDLAVRSWVAAVPGPLRWMPQANAAYRRLRAA